MTGRRDFLVGLGAALGWPMVARAQQKTMPVIGYVGSLSPRAGAPLVASLHQGLAENGYVEGQNVAIEYRWAEGHLDQLPAFFTDLVDRKVDVISAGGGAAGAVVAKSATSTIPIIFAVGADPVELGLVASLARPGSNLTGISIQLGEIMPKRFELLTELVSQASVIALLINPENPGAERQSRGMQEAVHAKGWQVQIKEARTEAEIDASFASLAQMYTDILVVGADAFFNSRRGQIVALASRYALPAIYEWREFVEAGGLMSYGPSLSSINHQIGIYIGKILNGAKPADLPVQQPTKFELVINLKAANALGLTVPQALLARADEVIE